jgi:hypothetical protein
MLSHIIVPDEVATTFGLPDPSPDHLPFTRREIIHRLPAGYAGAE